MSRIDEPWGSRTPYAAGSTWPVRQDTQLAEGLSEAEVHHWAKSACVLCSNGCGLEIAVKDGPMVGVRGLADDRVNRGRLGPKGLFGWQANASPDRLTTPLLRDHGRPPRGDRLVDGDEHSPQIASARCWRAPGHSGSGSTRPDNFPRGVLRPDGAGAGRNRDTAPGRQYAPMHLDSGLRADGIVRDGRPARIIHRLRYHAISSCMVGHNMAETQTVLMVARSLIVSAGTDRPRLVVIDPAPNGDGARGRGAPARSGTEPTLRS